MPDSSQAFTELQLNEHAQSCRVVSDLLWRRRLELLLRLVLRRGLPRGAAARRAIVVASAAAATTKNTTAEIPAPAAVGRVLRAVAVAGLGACHAAAGAKAWSLLTQEGRCQED